MTYSIREIPASERPRERLKSHGARALSSAELIAILIGSGSEKNSAIGIGHEILASARGSLRRLSAQPVAALTSLAGIGNARAVAVHAALELGRRMAAEERDEGVPVRCPRDVHEIFGQRLQDLPVEVADVGRRQVGAGFDGHGGDNSHSQSPERGSDAIGR